MKNGVILNLKPQRPFIKESKKYHDTVRTHITNQSFLTGIFTAKYFKIWISLYATDITREIVS